jgi:hypothetical protein
MEHEFPLQLIELQMLAVELGGNVGLPVLGDLGEFIGEIDLVHAA